MRNKMIAQGNYFVRKHGQPDAEGKYSMTLEVFKNWLDHYPFIRAIISESMMPRVWTLQRIVAVRPFDKEFMIDTNP